MNNLSRTANYIIAYVLWAVNVILGFLMVYAAREGILNLISLNVMNNPERTEREQFYFNLKAVAANEWTLLVAGIIMILVIVSIENFYRTSIPSGKLWPRFCLVTWIEFAIILLANIPGMIIKNNLGTLTWSSFYFPVIELLVTGFFIWAWVTLSKRKTVFPLA